jgi:penicillin-binding protein 1A
MGQGASMALPIYGKYMQKVYADKTIKISQGDFDKPSKKIDIEMDCSKYNDALEKETDSFEEDGGF